MALELAGLFANLATPGSDPDRLQFAVTPISGSNDHLLGKDPRGNPAVLISYTVTDPALIQVELEHLKIAHGVRCLVRFPDGALHSINCTMVRCFGDEGMHALFLRLMAALMASFEARQLAGLVFRLVELFRSLTGPSRRSVQGLWGELLVIASAADPVPLVRAWHADPSELVDFNDERFWIEVKTCSDSRRRHHFVLNQLSSRRGLTIVVCSLIVNRAGGGTSVAELVRDVADRISHEPDLLAKLETVVVQTLGAAWRDAARHRFDRRGAEESLRMYLPDQVPAVATHGLPREVTDVEFNAVLENATPTPYDQLELMGGLPACLVRRGQ